MWIERVATIITIIGSTAGAIYYMNDHYASAADLNKLEKGIKRDRIDDRIRDLNNKIFELEFKQRSTPKDFKPLDAAILERYRNDLNDLQKRARDLDK